jgi:hypothetical protein
MRDRILLEKKHKIIITRESNTLSVEYLATLLKNLESYGYTLSRSAQDAIRTLSIESLDSFYWDLVPNLMNLTGKKVEFNPLYPNFPEQVMKMSDAELYVNAILMYFGDFIGIRIIPEYEKENRPPLLEKTKLCVLDLATENDLHEIFENMMQSKTSLSSADLFDLEWYIAFYPDTLRLPEKIYHKEILAKVASTIIKQTDLDGNILFKYFKTPTDALRLAVALSKGDTSLAKPSNFNNISRKLRKFILSIVENFEGDIAEDFYKYRGRWIRLGERLHPGEFRIKFPRSCDAFDKIRNKVKISRFNSRLEAHLVERKIKEALELMRKRPGILARRLDHILRISDSADDAIHTFSEIAKQLSTPLLLQLHTHFHYRSEPSDIRVFFPKGELSKLWVMKNTLKPLTPSLCERIVRICKNAILDKFAEKEPLGKVYVDEALKDHNIPFSQRSAQKSKRTLVRGSKISIPEGNTIRLFIWWKEPKNYRVDIDLSTVLFSSNWNYISHISYTNLRTDEINTYHSGDLTSAPEGAAEFIDFDLESALRFGVQYIAVSLHNFTQQNFSILPECFAGWMVRQEPNSGEIFEPKTVQDKIDLTSEASICIPMIFDIANRKLIWADLSLKRNLSAQNNIEGNISNLGALGKSIVSFKKANLMDLISLHIEARGGKRVYEKKDADLIFSLDEGVTPFDIDVITSKYL